MARERVGEGWLVLESRGVMDVLEHDPQPALDPFVVGPPVGDLLEGEREVVGEVRAGDVDGKAPVLGQPLPGGNARVASRRTRSCSWSMT